MKMKKYRILIFGAGVIGSIFGGRLALAGHDVTLLARGSRLKELNEKGLLLRKSNQENIDNIPVNIISQLSTEDNYDFVFVIIRKEQVSQALNVLQMNNSQNFVFMVNNPGGYSDWTNALEESRVIPAFPGAGGKIENGIVYFHIFSKFIQPTTLGEINGLLSPRIKVLKEIISGAGFPVSISKNMDSWQKTHVALVGPLGDIIYYDGGNNYSVARNKAAIKQMNLALKESFNFLNKSGIGIEPSKLSIIRFMPLMFLNIIMKHAFNTKWAETIIYSHAHNARIEMKTITREFLDMAKDKGFVLKELEKMFEHI